MAKRNIKRSVDCKAWNRTKGSLEVTRKKRPDKKNKRYESEAAVFRDNPSTFSIVFIISKKRKESNQKYYPTNSRSSLIKNPKRAIGIRRTQRYTFIKAQIPLIDKSFMSACGFMSTVYWAGY